MKTIKKSLKNKKNQPQTRRIAILRMLHSVVAAVFRLQGYTWEEHHFHGHTLGVWRKKCLRGRLFKSANPKVFVLVPGFGDSVLSWFTLLKVLEPIISCTFDEIACIDFPGFSGYQHHKPAIDSMEVFLKAGAKLITKLRPHTVLGHSLGGWLATYQAGTSKYKPRRIILVAPSGAFDSQHSKAAWSNIFKKVIASKNFEHFRPLIFKKEPAWFKFIAHEFGHFLGRDEIVRFMESVADDHLVEKMLPLLTSDVWLIWGDRDGVVPMANLKGWTTRLKPHVGKNQSVVLRGVGHTPQLESLGKLAYALGRILPKA